KTLTRSWEEMSCYRISGAVTYTCWQERSMCISVKYARRLERSILRQSKASATNSKTINPDVDHLQKHLLFFGLRDKLSYHGSAMVAGRADCPIALEGRRYLLRRGLCPPVLFLGVSYL